MLFKCCGCGHQCRRQRLKYRAAAVKRRIGDGHGGDAGTYSLPQLYETGGKAGKTSGHFRVNQQKYASQSKSCSSPDALKVKVKVGADTNVGVGWDAAQPEDELWQGGSEMRNNGVAQRINLPPSLEEGHERKYEGGKNQRENPSGFKGNFQNERMANRGGRIAETENLLTNEISKEDFNTCYLDTSDKWSGRKSSSDSGRGTANGNSPDSGVRKYDRKKGEKNSLLENCNMEQSVCSNRYTPSLTKFSQDE